MTVEPPDFIRFGREICGDLAQAERREWWLANGLGGYAAGTIAGTLTRRYHGLLVVPLVPPLGRYLVFAKADATLHDGDRAWPLFTNRWGSGAVDPRGHAHIESFRLDGRMPVWEYAIGDVRIEHRVWMEPGDVPGRASVAGGRMPGATAHTTYAAWRLAPGGRSSPLALRIRLLVNARDHHGNAHPWEFNPVIEAAGERLRMCHPDWFTLHLQVRGGTVESRHDWHEDFDLPVERERGLPDRDNHLCVGEALLDLRPGDWCGIVASLDEAASPYLGEALRRFRAHDRSQLQRARMQTSWLMQAPDWMRQLVLAADGFVFARPLHDMPDGESVIAGYPWFGDWGRDTMIALPGLTLATGRCDSARRILETFARFVDRGMLPNVFPGSGATPEYNTADAALWYIEAWRAYVEVTGDVTALKGVFPVLQDIVEWHRHGTRHGIGMDESDGLLRAGEPGVQLTWMDAKVGDWVVTPRIGKPVEINALWYNALETMADFADRIEARAAGHDSRDGGGRATHGAVAEGRPAGGSAEHLRMPPKLYRELAARARAGFQRFVRADGALYDVLDGPAGDDASLRPNQILAASLTYSPLSRDAQARVLAACGRELLTSHGLRSLAPSHPEYRPRYEGGVWERDGGYHQGPVWAWLLGHYALAHYRVHGDATAAQRLLEPIRDHLLDAGLGTVSEIFDGEPPHAPRGAPSQAWSVACALEAWWRIERAAAGAAKSRTTLQGD